MRDRFRMVACLIAAVLVVTPAYGVTITSSGGSVSVTRPAGGSSTPSAPSHSGPINLGLTQPEKRRLANAVELLMLTSMQTKDSFNKLEALNERKGSKEEILARLKHTQECCEAMAKAGKKLEDTVDLVMVTWSTRAKPEQHLALLTELFGASPAWARYRTSHFKDVPSFTMQLKNVAKATYYVAVEAGELAKKGIRKITSAVGYGHRRIGDFVGQKNWAKIMAFTKATAAFSVGTGGLILAAVSLPATGALTAVGGIAIVGLWTAGNISTAMTLVDDLNAIEGRRTRKKNAIDMATQVATYIGVVTSGNKAELLVNILGATGGDIAEELDLGEMSDEELAAFLDDPHIRRILEQKGLKKDYRPPSKTHGERDHDGRGDRDHSGGGGGSCSDGCGN